MNRCPITYDPCGDALYSEKGLKKLGGLSNLDILNYSAAEQRSEAFFRASKISIQGVQPKYSAILNLKDGRFEMVDRGGRFILKPQHQYHPQLPENEDLTMKMASAVGFDVPLHGMVWSKDNSLTYFIRRFDRTGQKEKIPIEDFAQLAGLSRDTKYDYSMEKVVKLIDEFCTFPAVEKIKLFKLVIFCFLTGNEDMHLKNFSIINRSGKIELSPCYDHLNTTIVLQNPEEEIALAIKGRKKKLSRANLVNYFGKERCEIPANVVDKALATISEGIPAWRSLIDISFLEPEMKIAYLDLLDKRLDVLKIK